ncbi:MAG: hypothetical protein QM582_08685 [Micropruina sp.]|uniref:SPOR domain-containing protein n=1 Tax=Micropruina sp. TaxID=2737536 RepID=UPI0039E41685
MSDGEWYWCLKHRAVEPYEGCRAEDRLGPYPTRADAEQALAKVRERNDRWDREDDEGDADAPSFLGG